MPRAMPSREQVTDTQPLRLDVAASLAFPDGSIGASGLRREARKGRLAVERIAGKDYTTLRAIEEMRELCRVQPKVPACGSNQSAVMQQGTSAPGLCGSSATDRGKLALAALLATAQAPSKPSRSTSPGNTKPRACADVIPLKSTSQTS